MRRRDYKRIDLFIPAMLRDALDRTSPLVNAAWLVAFVLYVGWVVFFVIFAGQAILTSKNPLGELFSEEMFKYVITTAMVGGIVWLPGAYMRAVGGAMILYVSSAALFSDWPKILWGVFTITIPSKANLISNILLIYLTIALTGILSQIWLASIALILFARDRLWAAFASGGKHEYPRLGRIMYLLGLAETGFYRGGSDKAVMLVAKFLMLMGVIGCAIGLVVLYMMAVGPSPKGSSTFTTADLGVATAWTLGGGLVFVGLAVAIGLAFRRFFRPSPETDLAQARGRPIFLRSYRDDSVRLRNARSLSPLPLPFDMPRNVDEMVLAQLPECVAFARPDNPDRPFGVKRYDLRDIPWRDAVLDMIDHSSLLLISVDTTEGIDWEISQVLWRGHAGKAKFLMHPRLPLKNKKALTDAFAIQVSRLELRFMRGLDVDDRGQVRLYLGPRNNTAYRCMLGWMLNR